MRINPYNNLEESPDSLGEEDVAPYLQSLSEDSFHTIPEAIRGSFEFGAACLNKKRNDETDHDRRENHDTLKNALPGMYGENLDTFEVWISELIQNAHDAQWEEDGERKGAETFRFDISSRSFLFAHDGRPPQFVRLGLNEVEKMTINSTSKHAQYSTEGQFGIGFKLWLYLFNQLELSYRNCTLRIDLATGSSYPSYTIHWMEGEDDGLFKVEATNPKSPDLLEQLVENDAEKLKLIFQRSVEGCINRPHPFEFLLNLPDTDQSNHVQKTLLQQHADGAILEWSITASDGFQLPSRIFTFTQQLDALTNSSTAIREVLKDEIDEDQARAQIIPSAENEVDVSEVVENTVKDFEITIAFVPRQEVQADLAMYSSLFPIPGTNDEYRSDSGVCFVSKFALLRERLAFDTRSSGLRRNEVLFFSSLECYVLLMHTLSDMVVRDSMSLTTRDYLSLLELFSKGGGAAEHFVEEIASLGQREDYGDVIQETINLLSVYPNANGGLSSYQDLRPLRAEVQSLMKSEHEALVTWSRDVLEEQETVFRESDGTLTPYHPLVEAWSYFSEDAQNWTDRDGPNIPMEDLVEWLPWGGDWPSWLKTPVSEGPHDEIVWMSTDELNDHFVFTEHISRDESTEFEQEIARKVGELGVLEYIVSSPWRTLVGEHDRFLRMLRSRDRLFELQINKLIHLSEDGNHEIHEILERTPQTTAKFPFFFLFEDDEGVEVIRLNSPVIPALMMEGEQNKVVFKIEPSPQRNNDFSISSRANHLVATSLYDNQDYTHVFEGDLADDIIRDLNDFDLNAFDEITRTGLSLPEQSARMSSIAVSFPPDTPEETQHEARKWINAIPHVGHVFEVGADHVEHSFKTDVPANEHLRGAQGRDRYVVVHEANSLERATPPLIDARLAQCFICTDLEMERHLRWQVDYHPREKHYDFFKEFTSIFRLTSYSAALAEQIISQPSHQMFVRFIRSLQFTAPAVNPAFVYLHLGGYFHDERNIRNVRIIEKRFLASELVNLDNGHLLMDHFVQHGAFVLALHDGHDDLTVFLGPRPGLTDTVRLNSTASRWFLESGKLAHHLFTFALQRETILLPDTILFKSDYFSNHPADAARAIDMLGRNNLAFIETDSMPVMVEELWTMFFLYFTRSTSTSQVLLNQLMSFQLGEDEHELMAYILEAFILFMHEHLTDLGEEMQQHYWSMLAGLSLDEYNQETVRWSTNFEAVLQERENHTATTIPFLQRLRDGDIAGGYRGAVRELSNSGMNRTERAAGMYLVRPTIPILDRTFVYFDTSSAAGQSCFPQTVPKRLRSERHKLYGDSATLLLRPSDDEWNAINEAYGADLAMGSLSDIIVEQVKSIFSDFQRELNESVDELDSGAVSNDQPELEFLRRLILRSIASNHDPHATGTPLNEILARASARIRFTILNQDSVKDELMFPTSEEDVIRNLRIGPCGLGFSIDNHQLSVSLGPWLNTSVSEMKLGWMEDLFGIILNGNLGIERRHFMDEFHLTDVSEFLSPYIVNALNNRTQWLDEFHQAILAEDQEFRETFEAGDWQDVEQVEQLIDSLRDNIMNSINSGALTDAGDGDFELMYDSHSLCSISGYLQPSPTGASMRHKVRLRKPEGPGVQPVMTFCSSNVQGWQSLGNTLWVSPSAAAEGRVTGGWRLYPPTGENGLFTQYLAHQIESLYLQFPERDFIVLENVVGFQDDEGHEDPRFDLELHKLHALYIIAYDKYCQGIENS